MHEFSLDVNNQVGRGDGQKLNQVHNGKGVVGQEEMSKNQQKT